MVKLSLLSLSLLSCAGFALAGARSPRFFADLQRRASLERRGPAAPTVDTGLETRAAEATISFSNPKAKNYLVDGTKIPEVDFDVGPSWAGLMPISGNANETRKLFFWFWPTTNKQNTNDLVFWTNETTRFSHSGGPGCSSLEGLLQENGPFVWPTGTGKPIRNQWAWTNLRYWRSDEDQLAAQFAGFLAQFLGVFSELKGKNFYAAGESYAGFYVPYIANYLYTHPKAVDLNLKGVWITDPSVSYDIVTEEIPALTFAEKWQDVLALNSTFMAQLKKNGDACGYTDYYKKYATYPPKGKLPLPKQAYRGIPNLQNITNQCELWGQVYEAAVSVNPNFNVYRIFDVWPVLWDVLGFPGMATWKLGSFDNQQSPLYFNRTDVQDAIHAPHIDWSECSAIASSSPTIFRVCLLTSGQDVFVHGRDNSVPVMLSVMPNVIEKSERTVVMHGGIEQGGGKQGFQTPIQDESFIIEGFGVLGAMHQERSHMMPQYAPWAAYKTLSFLLGRENLTDHSNDAALYPSDYELYGPGPRRRRGPGRRLEL
ncbi:hypothetical protein FRC10_009061 [Ceratobasidium sp. 414]|nr:hypothetical protein FRC10_009061 [Ceratobasidium sp. 414]